MTPQPLTAEQAADRLLPLNGPRVPDQVIEAARTIAELVRRLNHATRSHTSLQYPPQMYRTVGALHSAMAGLDQTFHQLADRLHAFGSDPRVQHDDRGDAHATCNLAADQLQLATTALGTVTHAVATAHQATSHLSYDPSPRRQGFPAPTTVHDGHGDSTPPGTPAPPDRPNGRTR